MSSSLIQSDLINNKKLLQSFGFLLHMKNGHGIFYRKTLNIPNFFFNCYTLGITASDFSVSFLSKQVK